MVDNEFEFLNETTVGQSFAGFRRYDGLKAAEIEDLDSLSVDLQHCVQALDLRVGKDKLTRHYLWEQALVAYGRCFASGVRLAAHPQKFVALLPEVLRERHKTAIAMRNKFVSHSVNAMETSHLIFKADDSGVTSLQTYNSRLSPQDEVHPDGLRELAKALSYLILEREGMLVKNIENELNALPRSVLLSMPMIQVQMTSSPGMEGRSRARDRSRTRSRSGTTS
jgi:hypothetical protein